MAIDTAAKRASALNIASWPTYSALPVPDGSVGDGDKAHILNRYAGIAFNVSTVVGGLYMRVDANGYLDFGDEMIGIYLGAQP